MFQSIIYVVSLLGFCATWEWNLDSILERELGLRLWWLANNSSIICCLRKKIEFLKLAEVSALRNFVPSFLYLTYGAALHAPSFIQSLHFSWAWVLILCLPEYRKPQPVSEIETVWVICLQLITLVLSSLFFPSIWNILFPVFTLSLIFFCSSYNFLNSPFLCVCSGMEVSWGST